MPTETKYDAEEPENVEIDDKKDDRSKLQLQSNNPDKPENELFPLPANKELKVVKVFEASFV